MDVELYVEPSFPEMDDAIAWLKKAEICYHRPSKIQLKIGNLSYYPSRGTMNRDNETKMSARGLAALRVVLQSDLNRELPPVA